MDLDRQPQPSREKAPASKDQVHSKESLTTGAAKRNTKVELPPPSGPMKTGGQADYEADLQRRPHYHDGTDRKTWDQLGAVEKWSWERPHKVDQAPSTVVSVQRAAEAIRMAHEVDSRMPAYGPRVEHFAMASAAHEAAFHASMAAFEETGDREHAKRASYHLTTANMASQESRTAVDHADWAAQTAEATGLVAAELGGFDHHRIAALACANALAAHHVAGMGFAEGSQERSAQLAEAAVHRVAMNDHHRLEIVAVENLRASEGAKVDLRTNPHDLDYVIDAGRDGGRPIIGWDLACNMAQDARITHSILNSPPRTTGDELDYVLSCANPVVLPKDLVIRLAEDAMSAHRSQIHHGTLIETGISKEVADTLQKDLRAMNQPGGMLHEDAFRYEAFSKRLMAAEDGSPKAVAWAMEWYSEILKDKGVEVVEQRAAREEEARRHALARAELAAGRSGNPHYQAFLDTVEDPASLQDNVGFLCFMGKMNAEMDRLKKKLSPEERKAFIRSYADQNLSERVKAQRVPPEATHFIDSDGTRTFYRKFPAPNLGLMLLGKWENGDWAAQTGGPLPWSDLKPIDKDAQTQKWQELGYTTKEAYEHDRDETDSILGEIEAEEAGKKPRP